MRMRGLECASVSLGVNEYVKSKRRASSCHCKFGAAARNPDDQLGHAPVDPVDYYAHSTLWTMQFPKVLFLLILIY